jgi:2-polyprenyl-3-methyl-5-hydroxy-6-metoxy-1,4-benzoquinol methylase
MKCRHCAAELRLLLVDLGEAPPSNAYLTKEALRVPEKRLPLRVLVCEQCWLVQTEDFAAASELFDAEYAYFSSFSPSWLAHCERHVAEATARFALGEKSHVVEVAANDGYLLQYVKARGIPCTGIEPTASTARAARDKGIPVVERFFGVDLARELAREGRQADLMIANNVLAHVPDINDFVSGFTELLKPQGVAAFEFPHLMKLVAGDQFDTIYHEHYSYLSLIAVERIFRANGLAIFDVHQLDTHGGSLRVLAQRSATGRQPVDASVGALLEAEKAAGMTSAAYYRGFQLRVDKIRDDFRRFLDHAKTQGKTVAGYGAAAKGNTLMNYAGTDSRHVAFVVDRNPAKQGKFLPGSHIPIAGEEMLRESRPAYVLILPWNLTSEIMQQLAYVKEWNASFVTAVPKLEVRH